ncbi:hypothetical protein [Verminephrobacter aporrectodeae]|uniref:hypothetical protein n=1 Tax=Verminephrobacter aporrectodeae TaxID=1110389 RepID=UPI0002377365|nr:hypothetical protein [Verminephrobacter aporrectodeae]MCW8177405.1 general secretion pathway protein GspI [Verminephrobacter aporrectodeae subsp. tuberculatae]MCW8204844.1 general secretion pathway protein GspI [Verminephrobacter aporrectodeae subsp. tuberculatae]
MKGRRARLRHGGPCSGGRRAGRWRGLGLLEALVAMAIASLALASLYRTVGQSSRSAAALQDRVEAALVARSALAGSTFAEDVLRQSSGVAGVWHWSIQVLPDQLRWLQEDGRPADEAPLRAAQVTVTVTRGPGGPTVITWTTWKPYRPA